MHGIKEYHHKLHLNNFIIFCQGNFLSRFLNFIIFTIAWNILTRSVHGSGTHPSINSRQCNLDRWETEILNHPGMLKYVESFAECNLWNTSIPGVLEYVKDTSRVRLRVTLGIYFLSWDCRFLIYDMTFSW